MNWKGNHILTELLHVISCCVLGATWNISNNNMGPKLRKTQYSQIHFIYPLKTLPFYTPPCSPSPHHWNILHYQDVFNSQGSFPMGVSETLYHTLTYTPTQLPPDRHIRSLSAEIHCPAPLFGMSQHPLTAMQDSSTSTEEQPLLPRWYILNKVGDVILLGR